MSNKLKSVMVCIILIFAFFGAGLLNFNYSGNVKQAVAPYLENYFSLRGEQILEINSPDYSLGQVEVMINTDLASYYLVLEDSTPIIVKFTVLNWLWGPTVSLRHIENYEVDVSEGG